MNESPGWLPVSRDSNTCDDPLWRLAELREQFEVRDLPRVGWLALSKAADSSWLRFAVLDFEQSDGDGSNVLVGLVFHGEGPSDPLRECRHTYWGDDGYIFYPNGALIADAFVALSEFFDNMVKS